MIELNDLPDGWITANIENVTESNPKHSKDLVNELEISFIPMSAVDEITGTIKDYAIKPLGDIKKGYAHFADGDVIFAKITPCMENGKCAVAKNLTNGIACGSTEFQVLRPNGLILSEYLHRYLRQESYRNYAAQNMTGVVGQRRVPRQFLLDTEIPLPPLNEQRRIVSTIEQLTDRSNKARAALEDVPKLIAQFRQSVLAAAFRGDLTADWREKNPDIEPASELLERIRETLPKAAQKKLEDELSDPFDIPDRWTWANLSSICCSISDGDHQPPPKANSGIPFITISNISSGTIDFSNTYYVSESYYEKIQDNKKARKGDIIYSVVGSYGIPVLINSEQEFCFQRHIAILKPHQNLISKYLLFALKSRFVFDQATRVATGTTQLTVTLSGLRRIKIPLISVPEQILIVEKIENLFKTIDRIEEQYKDAFHELNQLLDRSILAKAFRGELVPQDPNDEPAAVLLERIRAERKQTSTPKQRGKTTRKNSSKQLSINLE